MGHDYKPLFGCSIDADRVCVVVGERAGRRLTQLLSNPSAYASRGRNEVLHMHALSLKRSLCENRVGNVLFALIQTIRTRGKDGVSAGGVAAFLEFRSDPVQEFRTVTSTKRVAHKLSSFSCVRFPLRCASTAFAV
jgi:hypothetical protein